MLLTTGKMAANTIQFTGEQARSFANVSPEAWRHWRKVVPRLAAKRGKKARFSAGEVVGLAVVASIIGTFGVGIGGLVRRWDDLFELCAAQRIATLRTSCLVVSADAVRLVEATRLEVDAGAIVVPCQPIIERLWSAAFAGEVGQDQVPLPFAPQAVGGAKR